jgi:hypothetical protein
VKESVRRVGAIARRLDGGGTEFELTLFAELSSGRRVTAGDGRYVVGLLADATARPEAGEMPVDWERERARAAAGVAALMRAARAGELAPPTDGLEVAEPPDDLPERVRAALDALGRQPWEALAQALADEAVSADAISLRRLPFVLETR